MGNWRKKETVQEKRERLWDYVKNFDDTYVYIKYLARFFWVEQKKFYHISDAANNLLGEPKDLNELRDYDFIETFDNVCYRKWGKPKCFNLLDESKILLPSDRPEIHPSIEYLIENVCWNKKENIDWLHKAILYKYSHMNDVTIPAVVFFWAWWSGKGTIVRLLETIFNAENVLWNLGQRDLISNFDVYKWDKLIVEFAEISSNNTNADLGILNKLKNLIGAEKITINTKWVPQYEADNMAWFFISSNSNQPIRLDDKAKWNRRFTVIRTGPKLENTKDIYDAILNPEIVQNYLAWLLITYPEVITLDGLDALKNQEKEDLEEMSQNQSNLFWEWYRETYPEKKGNISKIEIMSHFDNFCANNYLESRDFKKYFWRDSKYPYKRIRINWKLTYGVNI